MSDNYAAAESISEALCKWEASSSEPINILVAGKKGSGKTTLYSALCEIPVKIPGNPAFLLNQSKQFDDYDMTVTDACSLLESSETRRNDLAIKTMKEIKCTNEPLKVSMVYTISINQANFSENITDNNDIKCMRRLTAEFGEQIWKHSVIALTFVNEDYALKKESLVGQSEDEKNTCYSKKISKWRETIVQCMKRFVLPADEAEKIPFVPVGHVNHPLAQATLEYDSRGESWVLKLWRTLAERAPETTQHRLISLSFQKTFQNPYFYFDSYLGLVKVHGKMYQEVVPSVEESEGDKQVSLAYSYLRILKQWYDNYYEAQERKIKCSKGALKCLQFWRGFKTTVKILVTGAKSSGKTSLINSMVHGKLKEPESPDNSITCNSEYKRISIHLHERSTAFLGQIETSDLALILVCIRLNETEEAMTRTLAPVAELNPSNLMVVLTFSNVNLSKEPLSERIEWQTNAIKRILTGLNVSSTVVERLRVSPASYHTKSSITDDPSVMNWIMKVWLNSIASSKMDCQSALAVFVNYFMYGGQKRKTVLPTQKQMFRECFLEILYNMVVAHDIEYV